MDRTRTQDLFRADGRSVTIIGAGGIGAITAITLGKMGFSPITVFDDDTVDDVNVATQFYSQTDIGDKKVYALRDHLYVYCSDVETVPRCERIEYEGLSPIPSSDIVISGLDSISSRKAVWQHLAAKPNWALYIEARMNAESLQLYCVKGDDHTFDMYTGMIGTQREEDFPELSCTAKATFYTANLAAAHIGYLCRRFITNQPLRFAYIISLEDSSIITV